MPDVSEEGPHVHQPCDRCGLVEAETDGLCAECATEARASVARGPGVRPPNATESSGERES